MANIIRLKHEKVLINIFYYLLSKGRVKGVTQKQYFSILTKTISKINAEDSTYVTRVGLEPGEEAAIFEEIVKKANKICSYRKEGIAIAKFRDQFIAKPTYNFMQNIQWRDIKLDWYPRQTNIFHEVIDSVVGEKKKTTETYKITDSSLTVAKKVAAKYINEIVEKYVLREIENGRWPKQCKNIDEYVFTLDIAPYIDEEGKAELFKRLYLNTISTVCRLIKENKGNFEISNWEEDMLAYANYLSFFEDEEFKFLIPLKHDKYKTHDMYIKCTISNDDVSCYCRKCIYSDSWDDDFDTYQSSTDSISDKEVEIMEKRIGKY